MGNTSQRCITLMEVIKMKNKKNKFFKKFSKGEQITARIIPPKGHTFPIHYVKGRSIEYCYGDCPFCKAGFPIRIGGGA